MVDRSSEFSFCQDNHETNGWRLHLHKTYQHKNWTAGTIRGVESLETNQADTGGVIMLRTDF